MKHYEIAVEVSEVEDHNKAIIGAVDNYCQENDLQNPSNFLIGSPGYSAESMARKFQVKFMAKDKPKAAEMTERAYLLVENLTLLRQIDRCRITLLELDDEDVSEARETLSKIPDIIQRLSDKIQIT